jgi:DNA polymerase-4
MEISRRVNAIYLDYTDLVDPFGIDESFLDVTASMHLFPMSPCELADVIRARVRSEIGITISVGVSFCRVFAKLGSDYKKPDATTVIDRENMESLVWPMPASALLYVGKRTAETLSRHGIEKRGILPGPIPPAWYRFSVRRARCFGAMQTGRIPSPCAPITIGPVRSRLATV